MTLEKRFIHLTVLELGVTAMPICLNHVPGENIAVKLCLMEFQIILIFWRQFDLSIFFSQKCLTLFPESYMYKERGTTHGYYSMLPVVKTKQAYKLSEDKNYILEDWAVA